MHIHNPARRLSPTTLTLRYLLFAGVSTTVNLGVQELVIRIGVPFPLFLSMGCGTAAGFAIKYVLDKHWIFHDRDPSGGEIRKVALYGAFSVVTTAIFWSAELGAFSIWGTPHARYAGAVAGLSIGYVAKYALDRRFVFRSLAA